MSSSHYLLVFVGSAIPTFECILHFFSKIKIMYELTYNMDGKDMSMGKEEAIQLTVHA